VDAQGYLSNLKHFVEKGEFNSIPDTQGNVWIADGEIYRFDSTGKQIQLIKVPERPSSLAITDLDGKTLYFTGRTSLYRTTIR
jgi:sugar lactone lactonase YvrE